MSSQEHAVGGQKDMLIFRIDKSKKKIKIHCDAVGISILLGSLAYLVGERASHVHLLAPSAGGKDLDVDLNERVVSATEVIIDYAEGEKIED